MRIKRKQKQKVAPIVETVDRRIYIGIILLLVIGTAATFLPVAGNGFTQLDDPDYITSNPHIKAGLTLGTVVWAFTQPHSANWHPLTWISHALDVTLFGIDKPGAHHVVSLLLHILSTVILFLALSRMTGVVWKSAFVAALFAIHPVHVESVAWAAERKDVLSTLFWMLTMYAYALYVEKPYPKRYLLVVGGFTLGLLAKPMLVTLPFVLLLLDYWPLRRSTKGLGALIVEKLPLFALVIASCAVTFWAQRNSGAVGSLVSLPPMYRLGNAFLAYASYIGKMIWPHPLSVFYPHPAAKMTQPGMILAIIGSIILLAGVTVVALKRRMSSPYLLTGWFWYLGTLIPVIGLVQVGSQGSADRYTYVPLIGLFVIIAWGIPEVIGQRISKPLVCAASVVLVIFALLTYQHAGFWKNSVSIFRHSVEVVPDSHLAWADLGVEYEVQYSKGNKKDPELLAQAIDCYRRSLAINHTQATTLSNYGHALIAEGDYDEAIAVLQKAVRRQNPFPVAHFNLGTAYMSKQQYTEALYEYRIAADQNTGTGKIAALQGVADMAQRLGRSDEQIAALREVIEVAPTSADAHNQLGMVLGQLGRNEEAIPVFETVVELDPKYTAGHYNIGYALIQMKRFAEAIPHLERAIALDPKFDRAIYQLGVAETQTGQYAQAWEHIHAVQDMGIMPDPGIVSTLRSKMPEPPR